MNPQNSSLAIYVGHLSRGFKALAAFALFFGGVLAPSFGQVPTTGGPLHRVGPIDPVHHFPQWYQDTTGVAFELGTVLTAGELAGGWVLLLPGDTIAPEQYVYPRATPSTFADEHFYWHAVALDTAAPIPVGTDPAKPTATTTRVLFEMGHEGTFSTAAEEVDGSQIVFTRIRFRMDVVPYSGDYVLETPYKTYRFTGLVAGQRLFNTDDYGVAQAPEGFVESLLGPIGPYLLPATSPGGAQLPPVAFEGRLYIADPALTYPVTGSPLGKNFVRLTGPNGYVWFMDRFSLTGRLKTGPVPSNISLVRASKFDAPGDLRLDVFAKGAPTLQIRLPGQSQAPSTQPSMTFYPAPPVMNALTGQLSIPTGMTGTLLNNNGPQGTSYYAQWISDSGTLPSVVTGRDDSGHVTSVPVTDTVLVTKADYSNVTKTLTVEAVTANLNAPAIFRLIGVDGPVSSQTFTASIQVPNLKAPPSKVTVASNAGGASTVDVTVGIPTNAFNHPPVAANDVVATIGNTPVVIPVLANDTDSDGDRLSIDSVTQPPAGTAVIDALAGTITFTATLGTSGLQTFTYVITDRRGGFSTATVSVTVNGPPSAVADTALAIAGQSLLIDVLSNDSDPDRDPLTITSVTQPTVNGLAVGTVSIANAGKALSYLPSAGTTGVHIFNYTISDGRGASATGSVSVTINTPPVAVADSVFVIAGQTAIINVLANDRDADGDQLSITAVSSSPRAILTILGNTVQFTPLAGVLPIETFTYTISDGRGASASANISVIQNSAPLAVADAFTVNLGVTTPLSVLANDTDPDSDALTISGVTQPIGAVASISSDAKSVIFTWNVGATGPTQFTYTVADGRGGFSIGTVSVSLNRAPTVVNDVANAQGGVPLSINVLANDTDLDGDVLSITSVNAAGGATTQISGSSVVFTSSLANTASSQSFTYTVSDGRGGSAVGTVTVTVNTAPVAIADSATTTLGVPVTISVLANDTDVNGNTLTVTSVTQSANGTVSIVTSGALANKAISFAPNVVGVAAFTYTVSDGNGGSAVGSVSVNVVSLANRVPVAVADVATTAGTTAVVINSLENDSDPDGDALTITAVTQPASGRVAITGVGSSVTYTPVAGASSAAPQTFNYTISDGRGGTATASATVTVKDVVSISAADYTVSKSLWSIAGTAGFNAAITITAGGTLVATTTADARGAWSVRPTLTIPAATTSIVVTSSQGGTATRAIVRK